MQTFFIALALAMSRPETSAYNATTAKHELTPAEIEFHITFPNQPSRRDPCAGEFRVESRVVVRRIWGRGVLETPGGRLSGIGVLEIETLMYRLVWVPPTLSALCGWSGASAAVQEARASGLVAYRSRLRLLPPLKGRDQVQWHATGQEHFPLPRVVPPLLLTLDW